MTTVASIPYQFSQAVYLALAEAAQAVAAGTGSAPVLSGIHVRDNPSSPSDLTDGERVVFIEDKDDDRRAQEGQAEGRTFTLRLVVINRSALARASADADMEAAKGVLTQAVYACGRALTSQGRITGFAAPREGRRSYRVEGLDVGGAVIWTEFAIDYRTPAPTRR
jgi:hypothetical protein